MYQMVWDIVESVKGCKILATGHKQQPLSEASPGPAAYNLKPEALITELRNRKTPDQF